MVGREGAECGGARITGRMGRPRAGGAESRETDCSLPDVLVGPTVVHNDFGRAHAASGVVGAATAQKRSIGSGQRFLARALRLPLAVAIAFSSA